jgi:hypothetical protein
MNLFNILIEYKMQLKSQKKLIFKALIQMIIEKNIF